MISRFTRARGIFGALRLGPHAGQSSIVPGVLSGTVARTDTAAKNLFKLPAGANLVLVVIYSLVASDAGTTATLSIGKTGSNTFYVNVLDVKAAATGKGQVTPNAQNMGAVGAADLQIVGIYAETGGASTTGGPWTATFFYTK